MGGELERERAASLPEELWENILGRLPAKAFAKACVTCHSWNCICNRILSRPKLLSALSVHHTLEECMDEALAKVLSKPIRPHFVMAFTGFASSLEKTHILLCSEFGGTVPLVTCFSQGLIGRDTVSNEVEEVLWDPYNDVLTDRGVLLTIGFIPGLKVEAVPLFGSPEISTRTCVESFLADINNFTKEASNCANPTGIVMFTEQKDLRYILQTMDDAFQGQTPIVGGVAAEDKEGSILYSAGDWSRTTRIQNLCLPPESSKSRSYTKLLMDRNYRLDAVALVFAKDMYNTLGVHEIHFTSAVSTGLKPRGPSYKVASVRSSLQETWLTAKREGLPNALDGPRIWEEIENEVGNEIYGDPYIGVLKRRKHYIAAGKRKSVSSFAYHGFYNSDDRYLNLEGEGIKTADTFRFYFPSVEAAWASRNAVCEQLKVLKQKGSEDCGPRNMQNGLETQVFGGLIFACTSRGLPFFREKNVDSSAFSEIFPGVPLAGTYVGGEIGPPALGEMERSQMNLTCSCLSYYSSVFLVMSYTMNSLETWAIGQS
ncbi:F-box/LRR-repeat protein At5g63520 [Amborella trichopoda]|uniref:FIST C-domain domain-containing protein n=1 Tax=Amborella trichopoda TaxID=13333 RepID=W1PRK7_AMBTC|nr:F-box/LRR-repeat protein At5g63520 [Amborella trichopoda]ERN09890.1 hypothetical protein AMTR_s00013p00140650 [Amborella trichopoda]|eukprot:XP_006848309.1 F-box/LRR-repeat protein At5g63520 [Amborella trichopoda]